MIAKKETKEVKENKEAKEKYVPRLREKYQQEIIPKVMEKYTLKNPMQVPYIEKIVVNMGVGEAVQNSKTLEAAVRDLAIIAGQKPVITKAKKSIAGFKVRMGMSLGCKVTLRGDRMYEFLDRFLSVVVPRMRDFRGFSRNSFDGHGNYSVGVDEQLVFPEINYDEIDQIRGMNITIVTSTDEDAEACSLLEYFGFPLKPR